MNYKYWIVFALMAFMAPSSYAQLAVSGGLTPAQIANTLVSSGVTISNVTITGNSFSYGTFDALNAPELGLTNGILLTTGDIANSVGPNNTGAASYVCGFPGYPLLNQLTINGTNDACILEFDFVPTGFQVDFKYVFASEEYIEFANSDYNDLFGFYVTGPGYATPTNVALLPNAAQDPVTINNVNPVNNSAYYYDLNGDGGFFGGPNIQYDGFTVPLTASFAVQPCQTYHIIMVIADVADPLFDSAVFIEGRSFESPVYDISIHTTNGLNDSTVTECNGSAYITLTRPSNVGTEVVNYTIAGTATTSADYQSLAGSYNFTAGQGSVNIPISILTDAISEATETVAFTTNISISCNGIAPTKTVRLYIQDSPTPALTASGDTICNNNTASITASSNPATATFVWYDAAVNGNIIGNGNTYTTPVLTGSQGSVFTYYVQGILGGGCVPSRIPVNVVVDNAIPDLIVSNDTICPTNVGTVVASSSSTGVAYTWYDAAIGGNVLDNDNSYTTPLLASTGTNTYYIQISLNGCSQRVPASVVVSDTFNNPNVTTSDITICPTNTATLTANSNNVGVVYSWYNVATGGIALDNDNSYTTPTLTVPDNTTTTYYVQGNYNGCIQRIPANVVVDNEFSSPTITAISPTICPNTTATLTTSSSNAGVTYAWYDAAVGGIALDNDNSYTTPTINLPNGSTQTYYAQANLNGCITRVPSVVTVQNTFTATIPSQAGECINSNGFNFSINETFSPTAIINWTFAGGNPATFTGSTPPNVVFNTTGSHAITVNITDAGCSASGSSSIDIYPEPVAAFNGTNLSGCSPITSTILANTTQVPAGSTYTWDLGDATTSSLTTVQHSYDAGQYTVSLTVTTANGCIDTETATNYINVQASPIAGFSTSRVELDLLYPSLGVNSTATDAITSVFNFGDGSSITGFSANHTYADTGSYIIQQIVSSGACYDTAYQAIIVNNIASIYVPNSFTPDDDGVNDVFKLYGFGIEKATMNVFDRWGNLVFTTAIGSNLSQYWDGKNSPVDLYSYKINAVDILGKEYNLVGNVNLLR